MAYMYTKFEGASFSCSRDMKQNIKIEVIWGFYGR